MVYVFIVLAYECTVTCIAFLSVVLKIAFSLCKAIFRNVITCSSQFMVCIHIAFVCSCSQILHYNFYIGIERYACSPSYDVLSH